MRHPVRFLIFTCVAAALAIAGIYAISAAPENDATSQTDSTQEPATPVATPVSMTNRSFQLTAPEAEAVKQFETKLNDYAALHQKMEGSLDPLGQSAKPEEIDEHREKLRAQIKTARVGAKPGDFFAPGMQDLIKRACATTVAGDSDGKEVKETIMDENPGKLPEIRVNDRYPDGIPVTTMPAQVLEALPKLPDYMEYRFLGKRLVLLDAGAGLVLDYTPDVLP